MSNKVLVLRTCEDDLSSCGGFIWPASGLVEAPDWDPTPRCGGGLHGALWGEGDGSLFNWSPGAKWLVVEVDTDCVVDLGGKVKFPRGEVLYAGTREGATALMPAGRAVIGGNAKAGDGGTAKAGFRGTAKAGFRGTAKAGFRGTATAGVGGTATAGDCGTATAGDYGTATAGDFGTATAGYRGTATAGNSGNATAGDFGTATAGEGGTATAGNYGNATAGNYGTATAGEGGTATAGEGGQIRIEWFDGRRSRLAVGYVGEDGIEPNVAYVVCNGRLTRKEDM